MNNTQIKEKARSLMDANRLAEAKTLYTQACNTNTDDIEAWHMLSAINGMLGLFKEAEACARKVIMLNPAAVPAYNNLGAALLAQDKIEPAEIEFNAAFRLDPENHETLNNLGNIKILTGDFPAASQYYLQSISHKQDYADAYSNLANALLHMHKPHDAKRYLTIALGYNAEHPEYLYNQARMLQAFKRYEEARDAYTKVLTLQPNMRNALSGIAELYLEWGDSKQAIRYYKRLLEITPGDARSMAAIASIKKDSREIQDSILYYQQAIQIDPDIPGLYSNYLFTLNYIGQSDDLDIPGLHKSWGKTLEDSCPNTYTFSKARENKQLTIGYVSHDFRRHSVAYFFEPIINHHDKNNFRIICYSTMGQHLEDDTTRRIKNKTDQWQDITYISDLDAAELIHKDKVDILVDLSGHTAWNRLGIFALRPAPIQVSYLGYPNTTGLSTMDYRITDSVADPTGNDTSEFTEQLLRLPHCFLTFQPPAESPATCKPPCLDNDHITFGSFNALPKISDEVLDCWCSLLNNIKDSEIILKCGSLKDDSIKENILEFFTSRAISADRIRLYSQFADYSEHMALYNAIDIALDTFPYNGTTTSCEALWMGVPVVTLSGKSHASRVSSSLLHELKLDELIAPSTDMYIKIATDLANDTTGISELRLDLRNRMSISLLGDHKAFTQTLENSYQHIWARYVDSPHV